MLSLFQQGVFRKGLSLMSTPPFTELSMALH